MNDENKFMSIGEIAKSIGVTRRMILNYEDRGLITPDKKEGETGNRYYTLDTLTRIRTIRTLQDVGLSLAEIRTYYNDKSDLAPILKRLETIRDELNLSIEKLRERIAGGANAEIRYTAIPQQTVYRRTCRSESIAQKTDMLRQTGYSAMRQYGTDISKRMYFIEFPLDEPDEISYCAAVPEHSQGEHVAVLPEVRAIMITHHGDYGELPAIRERLIGYAQEQCIELLGTCRHIYLEGPPQHKDPEKFITQVALPVKDRRRHGGDAK
ncbi:MAG: MerR family transcriptional regulator [Bacillota bacterium]|nr:MerR family transcriptional regulator [Bacillota bacterium]